jgi:hypothetical protein
MIAHSEPMLRIREFRPPAINVAKSQLFSDVAGYGKVFRFAQTRRATNSKVDDGRQPQNAPAVIQIEHPQARKLTAVPMLQSKHQSILLMAKIHFFETARLGAIAGAAGGLAEIAWVTLYAEATGGNAAILARGVTTATGVSALLPGAPMILGVAVHMTLAVTLGIVLAFTWRALSVNRARLVSPYPFTLAALVGVWAVNFFVVLPIVNPAFIHMVPYAVSLASKLLFGLAAAEIIRRQDAWTLNSRRAPFARSAL